MNLHNPPINGVFWFKSQACVATLKQGIDTSSKLYTCIEEEFVWIMQ